MQADLAQISLVDFRQCEKVNRPSKERFLLQWLYHEKLRRGFPEVTVLIFKTITKNPDRNLLIDQIKIDIYI